jgi:hypothetical protein
MAVDELCIDGHQGQARDHIEDPGTRLFLPVSKLSTKGKCRFARLAGFPFDQHTKFAPAQTQAD